MGRVTTRRTTARAITRCGGAHGTHSPDRTNRSRQTCAMGRLLVLPPEHAYDARNLPKLQLADTLSLLLPARDVEPAQFDRGVPRWHARLCPERQLSTSEAQLALAALNALPKPGVATAAEALAAICLRHGLDMEAGVIQDCLETSSRQAFRPAAGTKCGRTVSHRAVRCGGGRCELGSVKRRSLGERSQRPGSLNAERPRRGVSPGTRAPGRTPDERP
jgi:hypothetical protein